MVVVKDKGGDVCMAADTVVDGVGLGESIAMQCHIGVCVRDEDEMLGNTNILCNQNR